MASENNGGSSPADGLHPTTRIAVAGILVLAVVLVLWARAAAKPRPGPDAGSVAPATASVRQPRLLEVGGGTCKTCRMMVPVLEGLKRDFAGRLEVAVVDVDADDDAVRRYDIDLIPTQIFYDAAGQERARHEGFFAREDILAQWRALGVDLGPPASAEPPGAGGAPAGETSSGESALEGLFSGLSHAVEGTPLAALAAAFLWGILSILLSPCHLASIPLIVGFIDRQGPLSSRRASLIATLFASGILVTIAALGVITSLAGRLMGDVGAAGNWFVAVIFFAIGLHLLDVLPLPFSGPGQVAFRRKGALAAFILGLVFGIALGPCTFAFMAPMLAVTFRLAAASVVYGAILLLVYGVGHCAVIVVAGTSANLVQRYLSWSEHSRGSIVVRRACGALVLFGGLYLIFTAR